MDNRVCLRFEVAHIGGGVLHFAGEDLGDKGFDLAAEVKVSGIEILPTSFRCKYNPPPMQV